MIGFKSVKHQGWAAQRQHSDAVNHYPSGSTAHTEFAQGMTLARLGQHYEPSSRRDREQPSRM